MKSQRLVLIALVCILLIPAATVWADNRPKKSDESSESPVVPSDQPSGPRRILPPTFDIEAVAAAAIKLYDTNHDGKISGDELDKCPGLKAAIDNIDSSGKDEVTAENLAQRMKKVRDSRLGMMSLGCKVLHNGEPLEGAEVRFVPEKFLGKYLKVAKGTTDRNGMAMISLPTKPILGGRAITGVPPGFYRVEITKKGEKIPANYNSETIFGQEVAMDAKGIQEGIKFDLKY